MAVAFKQLVPRQFIPNATADLGIVPVGKAWIVKQISLFNSTAGGVPVNIYMDVATSKNAYNQIKINLGAGVASYSLETININERLVFGDGISGDDDGAGGASVNFAAFGLEEDV